MPRLNLGHPDDGSHTTPNGTAEAVELWLSPKVNGSGIDTAWAYHNQADVGQGIVASGRSRSSIFVTTKVPGALGRSDSLQNIRDDLALLNLSYVDLALVHQPCEHMAPRPCSHAPAAVLQDTWKGMQDALRLGLARAIGVSNFKQTDLAPVLERLCGGSAWLRYPSVARAGAQHGCGIRPNRRLLGR